jgi:hypothetical protein
MTADFAVAGFFGEEEEVVGKLKGRSKANALAGCVP